MADDDYLTMEDFADKSQRDIDLYEDQEEEENRVGKVRIRQLDPTFVVEIFDKYDMDMPEDEEEVEFSASENVKLMNEVVMAGLVKPQITHEDQLMDLGDHKSYIFRKVFEFSGLAEGVDDVEAEFPDDNEE